MRAALWSVRTVGRCPSDHGGSALHAPSARDMLPIDGHCRTGVGDCAQVRRLPLVAVLIAGAGAVHLATAVPHFAPDPLYGGLFVAAGWSQLLAAAVLLVRSTTAAASAVTAVNLGALAAWVLSRTTGLPLGHPGVEPVAVADAITVAFELVALGVLAARWAGWWRLLGRSTATLGVLGLVAVLAAGGSATAIASLGTDGHGHTSGTGQGAEAGHRATGSTDTRTGESAGPAHRHPDGTWHLHAAGNPHKYPDETVHVHRPADGERPSATTPQPTTSPASPHSDGHDHEH